MQSPTFDGLVLGDVCLGFSFGDLEEDEDEVYPEEHVVKLVKLTSYKLSEY